MKVCIVLQLTFALILMLQVTRAKRTGKDLMILLKRDDEALSNVGRPSTSEPEESQEKCQKDILIILDTSRSIGKKHFDNQVKPFLRNFISDKALNLGRDGTQLSLLLFSKYAKPGDPYYKKENDKTKLVIPFRLHYDAEMFERYVNNTQWEDVEGGHTRTDKALEIANDEVFPEDSPLNNRKYASDVIILITDGRPTGTRTVEEDTLAYAEKLKQKHILIIGVGVGDNIEDPKFWSILKDIASPGQAFRVKFDKFQSIKNTLVKVSCEKKNFSPGLICNCPEIHSSTIYLKPGEKSRNISWERPHPVCPGVNEPVTIRHITWEPALTSPATFEAGQHRINYKFFLSGNQEMECAVKLDVRACVCPREDVEEVPVKPGDTKVDLEWQVPVPSCLDCPSPLTSQSLSVGQHSMAYKYNIGNQFNVTCRVNFQVKGALCKGNGYNQDSQECCCGVIHDKKTGYECCGPDHFNIATHQCCDGDNIRKIGDECPIF